MRKINKRLLALIYCFALIVVSATPVIAAATEDCPGDCAHMAAIGTAHYDTLAEAFAAAADDDTVTVLADQTVPALAVDKAITLDLGEKTLTGTIEEGESLLTVSKDFTLKNGTVTAPKGTVLRASDCKVIIEEDSVITAEAGNAIELLSSGKLEIAAGEITAKKAAVVLNIADEKAMEASITGGKFMVQGKNTIEITAGTDATAPKDFVIGGTYNKVPTEYIPDYCRISENSDGTYTVTAVYNVSCQPGDGSGTMQGISADRGVTLILPACTFTAPDGKHFAGWDIAGDTYESGDSYKIDSDLTLTALWESHTGGTATCINKAVCSVCGDTYGEYDYHSLVSYGSSAATCTESGWLAHDYCTTCGSCFLGGTSVYASALTVPALEHDLTPVPGKEATCTEDGLLAHEKCVNCSILQRDGNPMAEEELVIPAAGHKLEKVAAVESSCTQPGTEAHESCTACQETFVNGKTVDAKALTTETRSHVLSDWESDSATHWKSCTDCGEIFRQHSHKDGNADSSCDECGYAMAAPAAQPANQQDSDTVSFPFLIPMIAAVVIALGGVILAIKKKSN